MPSVKFESKLRRGEGFLGVRLLEYNEDFKVDRYDLSKNFLVRTDVGKGVGKSSFENMCCSEGF